MWSLQQGGLYAKAAGLWDQDQVSQKETQMGEVKGGLNSKVLS